MKSYFYFLPLFLSPLLLTGAQRKVIFEPQNEMIQNRQSYNLFKNAKVTASSHWNNFTPQKAIDGNKNPNSHWAAENTPVWLQLNLQKPTAINQIKIWPYYGDGRIYQYTIEGSTDGKTWKMLGDKSANSIASSSAGDTFNFPTIQIQYVKVTVLTNSKGNLSGGHIIEIEGYNTSGDVGKFSLTQVEKSKRFSIIDKPEPQVFDDVAWRGERYNWQFYVRTVQEAKMLRIVPQSLVLTSNKGEKITLNASFVRYVKANNRSQADIIDPIKYLDIPSDSGRPIWVSADIPQNVSPGIYKGEIQLVANNQLKTSCPIQLKVISASLPQPKDWKIHLDLWQHPDAFARWHDVPMWSKEHFDLMRPSMERLAQAGQKTITCTLIHEAWGGQTYDLFGAMIEWTKKKDGSWQYDFTHFDQWVEFMMSCGITEQISCYTMVPWSLTFRYFDEAKNEIVDQKLQPGSTEYEQFWKNFLTEFTRHLRQKNWLSKTAIAMDERPDHLLRPASEIVKKYAPELKLVSAVNRPSNLTEPFYDLSVAYNHSQSERKLLPSRQAKGLKTTCYVCCGPDRPNTFTTSAPIESQWLPISIAAMNYDGFLRWAFTSWVENPLMSTDFTSWPTGDCFLIYPGNRTSIRFENLRDGIEDFEKINLLRRQNHPKLELLEKYLKDNFEFKNCRETPEKQEKNIKELNKILNQML